MDKWFKDILPDKDPYHNRGRDQMRKKGGPEFECLWFQWANTVKIQLSLLVYYLVIISFKINLTWSWYSWKLIWSWYSWKLTWSWYSWKLLSWRYTTITVIRNQDILICFNFVWCTILSQWHLKDHSNPRWTLLIYILYLKKTSILK